MATGDKARPRGTLVLAVMGGLCALAVAAIVVISRPQDRRTPVTERPREPPPVAQVGPGVHARGVPPTTGAPRPGTGVTPPVGRLPVPATAAAFQAAVDQVLRDHSAVVHQCFREAQERSANVHGRAELVFVIGEGGAVVSTAVAESDLGDPELGPCLQHGFLPVLFPPNPEGRFGHVNHVFNFPP